VVKRLKTILLFPIRLGLGICLGLWSLWFREYYMPRAPLFWGHTDRFVIYQTHLGRHRYGIILYDLEESNSEVIFESPHPVRLYGLRHPNELDLYQAQGDRCLCTVIYLQQRKEQAAVEHILPGSLLLYDTPLPKTLGLVLHKTACSEDECFTEFHMTTLHGSQVIGPRVPDRIDWRVRISHNEDILAYSDESNVILHYLLTGKEVEFPVAQSVVGNWANNDTLLAYSSRKRSLILIDGRTKEMRCIQVPQEGRFQKGIISPSGSKIAYLVTKNPQGYKGTSLFVYSIVEDTHTFITERAWILDVEWSQQEHLLSLAGVKREDMLGVVSGYTMRNSTVNDKEIIRLDGTHVVDLR